MLLCRNGNCPHIVNFLLDIRLLQLIEIQKETTPNWKDQHDFAFNIFKDFTDKRNQAAVEEFMKHQKEFDSNNQISGFKRETFVDLLSTFIIANKLPASFIENNPSFRSILGFCANMINNSRKSSATTPTIPSSQTMKNQLMIKFNTAKESVKKVLKSQQSLNFTTDLWKSPTSAL